MFFLNEVVEIVNAGILSPNIHNMPNSQFLVNQHVSGISKLNQMHDTHIHTNHTDVQIVKTNRPIGAKIPQKEQHFQARYLFSFISTLSLYHHFGNTYFTIKDMTPGPSSQIIVRRLS